MLEAEASKQKLGRQVFWLTAPDDPRRPSHAGDPAQWLMSLVGLADYSGGPATDSHRFPYCPPTSQGAAEPVEYDALGLTDPRRSVYQLFTRSLLPAQGRAIIA
jgi:hypothetical protein